MYTHTHTQTHRCTHMHSRKHSHTHTCMHAHVYKHTHTRTDAQSQNTQQSHGLTSTKTSIIHQQNWFELTDSSSHFDHPEDRHFVKSLLLFFKIQFKGTELCACTDDVKCCDGLYLSQLLVFLFLGLHHVRLQQPCLQLPPPLVVQQGLLQKPNHNMSACVDFAANSIKHVNKC